MGKPWPSGTSLLRCTHPELILMSVGQNVDAWPPLDVGNLRSVHSGDKVKVSFNAEGEENLYLHC